MQLSFLHVLWLVLEKLEGLEELESRWVDACLGQQKERLGPVARDLAKERFSRRPTYQRPCGFLLKERVQQLLSHAAKGDLEQANRDIEALLEITGGDPEIEALKIRAARLAFEPETMIVAAQNLLQDLDEEARPELIASIRRALSDACWWLRATECSREALLEIDMQLLSRPLARSIWVRRILLNQMDKESQELLDFLSGYPLAADGLEVVQRAVAIQPENKVFQYLLGFQQSNHGDWQGAALTLDGVGEPELWPTALIREASFRAGRLFAYGDQHSKAERCFNRALRYEPLEGHRVPIQRWMRYVNFYRSLN